MATKKTSPRLAKLAGKYAAMDDDEIWDLVDFAARNLNPYWKNFCRDIRALAASVLSQTEKGKPGKKRKA